MKANLIQKLGMIAGLAAASVGFAGCSGLPIIETTDIPKATASSSATPSTVPLQLAGGDNCTNCPPIRDRNSASEITQKPVEAEKPTGYNIRTRGEFNETNYTGSNKDTRLFKSTLGVSEIGKSDFLTIYNYTGKQAGKAQDWTSAGFTFPKFYFGKLENKVTVFGSLGDKEGVGIETSHNFGNWNFGFNAEEAISPSKATRLGGEVNYRINDKLKVGVGFDTVRTEKGTTNYPLVNLVLDADEHNQFGVAFRQAIGEKDTTNYVAGYWGHWDPTGEWGFRGRGEGFWNSEQRLKGIDFDVIFAQHPTFGKGSFPWIVERTHADSSMYNVNVVENPLDPERVPLGNRVRKEGGWVFEAQGCFKELDNIKSNWLRGDVGYNIPVSKDVNITPLVFARTDYTDGSKRQNCAGASVLVNLCNIGKASVTLEGTYTHRFDNDRNPNDFYGGIMVNIPIGGK